MILPLSLDASFAPRSPQITPSDRHFGIRRILCSLLRHKSYLTLLYVTSLRDSFCLGTFAHGLQLPCSLTSLRGCSLAGNNQVCDSDYHIASVNASQLTYQYATSIDNKFIINGCCIFRSYLAGLSILYGSTPV